MGSLLGFFAFLLFASTVTHGSMPMEYDLINMLPGQPEVKAKQSAGYIDVDREAGRSLFYYLVEAGEATSNLPLTIWLTGGPGCSSVGDAFLSVGPFTTTANARGLQENPFSWIKVSNLLFIDSPTGSGWSYSNRSSDYKNGDDSSTKDLVTFMVKWYEKYPYFKSRDLYLAGSSYAGHFVPNFANSLIDYKFNIKGLALGNPVLRRKLDELARYDFLLSKKIIDNETHHQIMEECNRKSCAIDEDNFQTKIGVNWTQKCRDLMSKALSDAFNTTDFKLLRARLFDVLREPCDGTLQELKLGKEVTKISYGVEMCRSIRADFYFNLPEVQKAFHGNRTGLSYPWKGCFTSNFKYNETDTGNDMLPVLKRLLQRSIPITIFSGDQDAIVPAMGTQKHLKKLAEELNFNLTKDEAWNGGWMYSYGHLLSHFTFEGANHHVTASRPSEALLIFKNSVLKYN